MSEVTAPWYTRMLDDVQTIFIEHQFTASWAIIQCHHEIGERLSLESGQRKISLPDMVQRVARDLNKSRRTLYYAVKLYETFPDLNKLPAGKDVSWRKVIKGYLTEGKGAEDGTETHRKLCPSCGVDLTGRSLLRDDLPKDGK